MLRYGRKENSVFLHNGVMIRYKLWIKNHGFFFFDQMWGFFIHQMVFILTTHTPMTSENADGNIKLDRMQPNIN